MSGKIPCFRLTSLIEAAILRAILEKSTSPYQGHGNIERASATLVADAVHLLKIGILFLHVAGPAKSRQAWTAVGIQQAAGPLPKSSLIL